MSDEELRALPVTVDLPTAARALGIGTTKAYELARAGKFPCPVLPLGARYRVTKNHLLEALGVSLDIPPSAGSGAKPVERGTAEPPAPAVIPEGGIPVVLVLQAVLLPGQWQQLASEFPPNKDSP